LYSVAEDDPPTTYPAQLALVAVCTSDEADAAGTTPSAQATVAASVGNTCFEVMPAACAAGRRAHYEDAKSALREHEEEGEGSYAAIAARTRARRTALDSVSMS
jgi:hypothetical protein